MLSSTRGLFTALHSEMTPVVLRGSCGMRNQTWVGSMQGCTLTPVLYLQPDFQAQGKTKEAQLKNAGRDGGELEEELSGCQRVGIAAFILSTCDRVRKWPNVKFCEKNLSDQRGFD